MERPAGVVRTMGLPWRDPDDVLWAWRDEPWLACLDSGGAPGPRARWTILCRRPVHVLDRRSGVCRLDGVTMPGADPFGALRTLLELAPVVDAGSWPFAGGVIGFAGYSVGQWAEGITTRHQADPARPELSAALYDHAVLFDRVHQQVHVATIRPEPDRLFAAFRAEWDALSPAPPPVALPHIAFVADRTPEQYADAVAAAVARIAAGEIFQVNITGRHIGRRPPDLADIDLYRALRRASPAPFGAWLACGGAFSLMSASPERFVELGRDGVARTRPIKGTRPRGATPEQDECLRVELAADDKERAENLMIVDLMRNDLGRVAKVGSVSVPELLAVETFAHLHHLVSEVMATLAPGQDAIDLLRASLPPGSVTGAPKHQAMRLIDELEASDRGPYCGIVFRIGTDGAMDSSVIIRALAVTSDTIVAAAGGGITVLSDPQREYGEMCLKIAPLLALFGDYPAQAAS